MSLCRECEPGLKAVANEDTLLRKHCCSIDFSLRAQTGKHLLRTQNVSEQNQKHCVRNKCCACGQTAKHLCQQQCVRNNVSSFASTLSVHLLPEAFGNFHWFLSSLPYYRKFQIYLMYRPLVFLISTICVFCSFIIGSDLSDVNVQNAEKINDVVANLQTDSRHRGSSAAQSQGIDIQN